MSLRISADRLAGTTTLTLRGDLDAASAYDVVRRIGNARAAGDDLVLDLRMVQRVDAVGLSRLLWCLRHDSGPGDVRLLARHSEVQRLLGGTEYAALVVAAGRHQPVPRPRAQLRARTQRTAHGSGAG